MTDKDLCLTALRQTGRAAAEDLQRRATDMTGTALNAEDGYLPDFAAAVKVKNMLDRDAGFVCRSTAGRAVRLIQPYDSDTYPAEPEELPAQWGFAWSTDPAKARPFIALATSPYNIGDCCTSSGKVWRSKMDNNVHSPEDYPDGWEEVEVAAEDGPA